MDVLLDGETLVTMYFVEEGLQRIRGTILDPLRMRCDLVTIGYEVSGYDDGVVAGSALGVEWHYYPRLNK